MSATVEQGWRTARADALEATADAVTDALAHVENVGQALEEREDLTAAGRNYAAFLRSARNDLMTEARTLRARGEDA
jgi:hypothetical protein